MGKKRGKGHSQQHQEKLREEDVYEAEEVELPEERQRNRYDNVENYEYELPSDFEDEEIDEDMAFTEEDKALYGHMFEDIGRKFTEDDHDERGDEITLLDSEEDVGTDSDDEDDELAMFGQEEDHNTEDSEERGGEEARNDSVSDDDRHQAMLAAVSGTFRAQSASGRKGRNPRDLVITEAYPESEYNMGVAGDLTLTDLIAGLGDSKNKLGTSRKALERLDKQAVPVSAPLPGPIRQRQERKAGYEETKKEVTKWMPFIKSNREAPTIKFTSDKAAVPRMTTTAALAASHMPETDMEAEVAALLESAGAHSAKAVAETEEALAMKSLSVEEARERQNRLAKMRALLFYHEVKAKRMKKIKSKEYHRKLKKAEKRKAVEGGEEVEDEEQLRQMMEEAEFERAKERLTLKHKNTSRWARRALRRGTDLVDDGTKAAIAEQLRLGQELRKKIDRMKPGGEDSSESTSASEDEGSDGGAAEDAMLKGGRSGRGITSKVKAAALDLLESGPGPAFGEGAEAGEAPTKGLFALPFMKRALEKRKAHAQEEAKQLLKELEADGGEEVIGGAASAAFGGRMVFGGTGGGVAAKREQHDLHAHQTEAAGLEWDSELDANDSEDTEAKSQRLQQQMGALVTPLKQDQQSRAAKDIANLGTASRPAIQAAQRAADIIDGPISIEMPQRDTRRGPGKRNAAAAAAAVEQDLQVPVQHQRLLAAGINRQQLQEGDAERGFVSAPRHEGREDGQVSIGPAGRATAAVAPTPNGAEFVALRRFEGAWPGYVFKKGPKGIGYYLDRQESSKAARLQSKAAELAEGDNEDERNMQPVQKANGAALSQADLVRMAFAGDDVAAQFATDKAEEVQGELPKTEEPGVLPGWGTWAGQQREPKWMVDAREKAKRQRASAAASRKDAKLQYVIISEKWDKKSSKYKTPTVPFPFTSREMYERTMRQPLGKEYNTDAAFRNLTRPAVLKDAGVIIEPIRFSKHLAESEFKNQPKAGKRAAVNRISGGMPKRNKAAKK